MKKMSLFTILRPVIVSVLYVMLILVSTSTVATAQEEPEKAAGRACEVTGTCVVPESELPEGTGTVGICDGPFNLIPGTDIVDENTPDECDCAEGGINGENCDIIKVLEIGTNVLAGAAAVAVVGGIMYGGFLYMTARDNPGQVQAAKARIAWALAALLILIFFWGFLQWLIPGGVLGGGSGGGGGGSATFSKTISP